MKEKQVVKAKFEPVTFQSQVICQLTYPGLIQMRPKAFKVFDVKFSLSINVISYH